MEQTGNGRWISKINKNTFESVRKQHAVFPRERADQSIRMTYLVHDHPNQSIYILQRARRNRAGAMVTAAPKLPGSDWHAYSYYEVVAKAVSVLQCNNNNIIIISSRFIERSDEIIIIIIISRSRQKKGKKFSIDVRKLKNATAARAGVARNSCDWKRATRFSGDYIII